MRYIHRLDNPLLIRSFGDTAPGGLGPFDPEVYAEVVGELPEGWQPEPNLNQLPKQLREVLNTIPIEGIPVEVRASVRQLQGAVESALAGGDVACAEYLIQQASIPEEMEAFRDQLLSLFP